MSQYTPEQVEEWSGKARYDVVQDMLRAFAALLRDREQQSPSYAALKIISESVMGALRRHGVTDCDDPGEAIDVLVERAKGEQAGVPVGYANVHDFHRQNDGFLVHRAKDDEFFTVPIYAARAGDARDAERYRILRKHADTRDVEEGPGGTMLVGYVGDDFLCENGEQLDRWCDAAIAKGRQS